MQQSPLPPLGPAVRHRSMRRLRPVAGRSAPSSGRPTIPTRRLGGARRWAAASFAAVASVITALLAGSGRLDGVPLLNPALGDTVETAAVLALIAAWLFRRRPARPLAAVLAAAALLTGMVVGALRLTGLVVDPYPASFALWVGLGLAALLGAPVVLARPGMPRRVAAVAAVPLTLAGALLLMNDEYGGWPTVGDLLGHNSARGGSALRLPPGSGVPGRGVLVAVNPPAGRSHFAHRPGSVYLPPAFFTAARAQLPVIIMLAGTPGSPSQWPTAGRAVATADAFAAAHSGKAPILLFVDNNGSVTGDTECVDGPRGNAETYLTVDVPAFVTRTLKVQRSPDRWAVAGFSEGGTCALDLTLAHPLTFRHLVDLAGDAAPTMGDAAHTRSTLFGGSAAAMREHDPRRLFARLHETDMTAWFAAADSDEDRVGIARDMAAAGARAGLTVHQFAGSGGHNWQFASTAFSQVFPGLCADLGLHS